MTGFVIREWLRVRILSIAVVLSWIGFGCNATPHPEPVLTPIDLTRLSLTLEMDGLQVAGEPGALDTRAEGVNVADLTQGFGVETAAQSNGAFQALLPGSSLEGVFRLFASGDGLLSKPVDVVAFAFVDVGKPVGVSPSDLSDCTQNFVPVNLGIMATRGVSQLNSILYARNECSVPIQITHVSWVQTPQFLKVTLPQLPLRLESGQSTEDIKIDFTVSSEDTYEVNTLLLTIERPGETVTVAAVTIEAAVEPGGDGTFVVSQ